MSLKPKGQVVRVSGLPLPEDNTPDEQLIDSLKQILQENSSDREVNELKLFEGVKIRIVPSCERESERVALVDFYNGLPEFLSDPLGSHTLQMNDSYLSLDRHFHGFTQLYTPKAGEPVTAE